MLSDEGKTKEQLISELVALRQRVAELETLETERKLAEEALRESEARLAKAQQIAHMGSFDWNVKDNTSFLSHQYYYIFGLSPREFGFTYEEFLSHVHPEDREFVKRKTEESFYQKAPHSIDYRIIRPDGSERIVHSDADVIFDEAGKPLRMVGMVQDITERKLAEEALRESESRFSGIAENALEWIWEVDINGEYTYASPVCEKILGYKPEELLGKHFYDLFLPEEREQLKKAALNTFVKKKPFREFINQNMHKNGEIVWLSTSGVPILDERGNLLGYRGADTDITERKQMEEALREAEERYRALVNLGGKVGEAVVMLQDTEQGNAIHTFVSNEWPRITGYSRKELLGMSFLDLLHPKHREASLKRHKRKMGGEIIPGLFEMSVITKDGTEVPIEVTSAYTTYRGQRANVAFIRDITERKQAEEREKELQQELYHASRLASIGELAAGVAHEISNPLTGILGFSQRLMRKSTDEEVSRDLARIHSEAQRVAKVVGNLLTFARRREPKKECLDINDILQRALELRAYALEISNIEVVTSLAPSLPKTMADFHQIQEVILNIILNAEQAMSEANGGGKLSVKTQQTGDYIRISFADDGPGIPAEHLDKVFDPFFTTRGEKGGTGLGLSLCHGIVAEHAGKIYAKSKPGKGATFFVELPLSPIGTSFADTY